MKTLLALALCFLATVTLAADSIETVDLNTFGLSTGPALEGKVVKMKFGWREGDDTIAAKGKGREKCRSKVIVPEAAKAWFAALPTKEGSPTTQVVYLRLHNAAPKELLGREMRGADFIW